MGLATLSIPRKRPTNLKGKAFADARNVAPPEPGCKSTGAICISKRITANLKGTAIATPNNGATTKTRRTTTGVEISYRSLGGPTYACLNCNAAMWFGAFMDTDSEEGVDGTIVDSLIRMLDANSAIAKAFRMARD
ncbi:hypothetical protein Tco_0981055 [Tanacetum coccineum]